MRAIATIFALLFLASASWAAVEVRITALPGAGVTAEGFMPAELVIADPNSLLPSAVRAVAVRRAAGGPTMFYRASIAPGARGAFRIAVPMVSLREQYAVSLLAEQSPGGPAMIQRDVPAETDDVAAVETARGRLIDRPAYDDYIEALPRWPTWAIRGVCITAALMMLAAGAALLIRGPIWRAATVGLVVAAAAAAMYVTLSRCPLVDLRQSGDLLVLSARRTTTWSAPAENLGLVYWRIEQMNADDMIYQPGKTLTVTLHPDEVRLLRRTGGKVGMD